jgi:hypothetical protein
MELVGLITGREVRVNSNTRATPMTWVWRQKRHGWWGRRKWDEIICNLGANTPERRDATLTFSVPAGHSGDKVLRMVDSLLPATHRAEQDD